MTKTIAEQIADLHALKTSGAITEEEFTQAKNKLLGAITERSGETVGETLSSAANAVSGALSNSMGSDPTAFKNLAWALYWGTVGVNIIGLFPPFAWIHLLLGIGIVVVAALKMAPSAGSVYNSHFKNIVTVAVVSVVGYLLLILVTVGTLGIGIIVTGPLLIALLVWYVYRIVKGMMRLNEGKEI